MNCRLSFTCLNRGRISDTSIRRRLSLPLDCGITPVSHILTRSIANFNTLFIITLIPISVFALYYPFTMDIAIPGIGTHIPAWWFKADHFAEPIYLELPTRATVAGILVSYDNLEWLPVDDAFLVQLPATEDARTTWINHSPVTANDVHFTTANGDVVSDRVERWGLYNQFFAACSRNWYPVTDLPAAF
ncbi:hypothetical protein BJ508DRAFT_27494 [Ascobolus immersus RN42]|uniref:Uncharacterized protein n=1 Tax=Ascobolus immersus RN42 TaxID=1160509 RepID=A0A3N4IT77_ASCIM|nr:hypothetical protein BJ508DRAFT_27494 [Ascobolus immersus RN42]